jgi:hypothetical protein
MRQPRAEAQLPATTVASGSRKAIVPPSQRQESGARQPRAAVAPRADVLQ